MVYPSYFKSFTSGFGSPENETVLGQGRPYGCHIPEGDRMEWHSVGRRGATIVQVSSEDKLKRLKKAAMESTEAMRRKRDFLTKSEGSEGTPEVVSRNAPLMINVETLSDEPPSFVRDTPPHLFSNISNKIDPDPTKSTPRSDHLPTTLDSLSSSESPPLDYTADLSLKEVEEQDFIPFPPSPPLSPLPSMRNVASKTIVNQPDPNKPDDVPVITGTPTSGPLKKKNKRTKRRQDSSQQAGAFRRGLTLEEYLDNKVHDKKANTLAYREMKRLRRELKV
ncbi:hypothetical protein I302_105180 [Kwoniella bestiolae CBS 10118]|uniref:Uncharacterized protein n=1 Tax=Kwoniella bestiolae CBS 10118 TaxID=1296100 RepID=A0A1B9FSF9_9TREE|nr:hypothetical protein I302_08467 [Kwoniella bestiolae CBS 10118]OCF21690.1 hypothetical protein I302_08467 [Kwoniella bestiolae CBS 10118]